VPLDGRFKRKNDECANGWTAWDCLIKKLAEALDTSDDHAPKYIKGKVSRRKYG